MILINTAHPTPDGSMPDQRPDAGCLLAVPSVAGRLQAPAQWISAERTPDGGSVDEATIAIGNTMQSIEIAVPQQNQEAPR